MEESMLDSAKKSGLKGKHAAGLALRSSAVLEDTHFSFAGQYATFLNITPQEVPEKYKEIVASQFNARSLFYMKSKGILEEEMAMAVACQNLIPAKASGVLFTSHFDPEQGEVILINALWGLGKWVVDGTISPDLYLLDKNTGQIIRQKISQKQKQLTAVRAEGLLREEPVPESLQDAALFESRTTDHPLEMGRFIGNPFQTPPGRGVGPRPGRPPVCPSNAEFEGLTKKSKRKKSSNSFPGSIPSSWKEGRSGLLGSGPGRSLKSGPMMI